MPRKLTATEFADALRSPNVTTRVLGGANPKDVGWAISWARARIRQLAQQIRRSTIQRQRDREGNIGNRRDLVVFDRRYYFAVSGKNVSSIELFLNAYNTLWTITIRSSVADAIGVRPIMWGGDHSNDESLLNNEFDILNVGPTASEEFALANGLAIGAVQTINVVADTTNPIVPVRLPALGAGLTYTTQAIDPDIFVTPNGEGAKNALNRSWLKTITERAHDVDQKFVSLNSILGTDVIFKSPPEFLALGAKEYMSTYLEPIYWDQVNDLVTCVNMPDLEYSDGHDPTFDPGFFSDPATFLNPSDDLSQRKGEASTYILLTLPRTALLDAATQNQDLSTQRPQTDFVGIGDATEWPRHRHIIESRSGLEPGEVPEFEWGGFTGLKYVALPTVEGEFEINSGDFGELALTTIGGNTIALNGIARGTVFLNADEELVVSSVRFFLSVAFEPAPDVRPRQGALDLVTAEIEGTFEFTWLDIRSALAANTGLSLAQIGSENSRDDFDREHPGGSQTLATRVSGSFPQEAFWNANHPEFPTLEFGGFVDLPESNSTEGGGGVRARFQVHGFSYPNIVAPVLFTHFETQTESGDAKGIRCTDVGCVAPGGQATLGILGNYQIIRLVSRSALRLTFLNGVPIITGEGLFDSTYNLDEDNFAGTLTYDQSGFSKNMVSAIGSDPTEDIGTSTGFNLSFSGLAVNAPEPSTTVWQTNSRSFLTNEIQQIENPREGVAIGVEAAKSFPQGGGAFDNVIAVKYNGSIISSRVTPASNSIQRSQFQHDNFDRIGTGEIHSFGGSTGSPVGSQGNIRIGATIPTVNNFGSPFVSAGFKVRGHPNEHVLTEGLPSGFDFLSIYWPNAIAEDEDNPGLKRDGVFLAELNDGAAHELAHEALQAGAGGTEEEVAVLRAAVRATMTVLINNFASDEFMTSVSAQETNHYVILQPS